MQIAQVMAGYSLGQADLLRRAMGKKDKNEMAKQQALFVEGALKNGVRKSRSRLHLRAGRQVRRLRLQQIARGSLCRGQLSHRLPEGEFPRGIHRRVDDARYGQYRQAGRLRSGSSSIGDCRAGALRQPLGCRIRGDPATFRTPSGGRRSSPECRRGVGRAARLDRLCAGGLEEHRRHGGRDHRHRARGQRAVQGSVRLLPPSQPQGAQQARARDTSGRRVIRRAGAEPGADPRQCREHHGAGQPAGAVQSQRNRRSVRRRGRRRHAATRDGHEAGTDVDADGAAGEGVRRGSDSICRVIRSTSTSRRWRA